MLALGDELGSIDPSLTATDGTSLGSPGSLRGEIPLWRVRAGIREVGDELEALSTVSARLTDALTDGGDRGWGTSSTWCVAWPGEDEIQLRRRLRRLEVAERVGTERALAERWARRADPSVAGARLERREADLAEMVRAREDMCARYAENVAAGSRGTGRAPKSPDEAVAILRQRELVRDAKKNCSSPRSAGVVGPPGNEWAPPIPRVGPSRERTRSSGYTAIMWS